MSCRTAVGRDSRIGLDPTLAQHNRVPGFCHGILERDGAGDRDVVQLTILVFQF